MSGKVMHFCVLLKFDKSEFAICFFIHVGDLILQETDLLDGCEDVKPGISVYRH